MQSDYEKTNFGRVKNLTVVTNTFNLFGQVLEKKKNLQLQDDINTEFIGWYVRTDVFVGGRPMYINSESENRALYSGTWTFMDPLANSMSASESSANPYPDSNMDYTYVPIQGVDFKK